MTFKDILLEENVGGFDLFLRALIGSVATIALAMGLVETSPWNWLVALVALAGLFTAMIRHCTPYHYLGINTAKK
ncbi:hypothetical protein C7960_0625 [Methanohalophilus euhalobius]|jgi:hypothetical protein|uniref:Inner membrane protein YgaP-like transmembrane domain-containing protein n=1 Tax=Methanohalophilus euhalobius TaxID=51203 RepID=A0A285FUA9_9EURY|nr:MULTISPECIES: DUF2892 domain-containing protein [Methanohalophilus]ODV49780.1 MAG: hypothetical protein A8273_832 [Methanohalophilus sp. 2-GBenrich]RSD35630.1 MAG: hypothetical protein CI952_946 [Methanohalophilus sp.]TCL11473.1 hypothetical protein C7960_0625 [Methanohalophilus euhalobius]SNY14404.1 Protein of unknown function [Methanohalophilus euhalobius]